MYAANIADLTAHAHDWRDFVPLQLLRTVLDLEPRNAVECERGKAVGMGYGALFVCDDERAVAIVTVIRKKYKKYQWRFYQKASRGWRRI